MMNGFDLAVLLFMGGVAILGFARGFVQESLSLSAIFASVLAIRYAHTAVSTELTRWLDSEAGAAMVAFLILLAVPAIGVRLIARWLGAASRNSILGPFDRILGFGFGAIKAFIIIVVVFSIAMLGNDLLWGVEGRPEWITQARTYRIVNASSNDMVKMLGNLREEQGETTTDTDTTAAP